MTITDEAKQLRSEITKLRPDKRRRYAAALRGRILDWIQRVEEDGGTLLECSKFLGIKTERFKTWRMNPKKAKEAPVEGATSTSISSEASESVQMVPVDIAIDEPFTGLALVAPSGHRVEGLTFAQAMFALKELA